MSFRVIKVPPLVPGWPVLGNALEMAADPVQFWVTTARKYGHAYRVRYPTAPSGEMTVLAGLEANEFATRHGHEAFTTRQYYAKLTRETGTKNYLCALDGDLHAFYRKVVKPALSREGTAPFVQDMIRSVEQRVARLKDGDTIPVLEFIQRITVDELSLSAAGCPFPDNQYGSLVRYSKTFIGSGVAAQPEFLLKMPGYKRAKREIHQFLNQMIADREHSVLEPDHRADLMDIVAWAKYPDGKPFNELDRVANAHLPYANGYLYAGRICGNMLYALLTHPQVLNRVRQEVDRAFAQGTPSLADLAGMSTLRNCVKETLRLYPIAPAVPRYAARTFGFQEYTIPEGSYVFIAVVVPHFDDRYFVNPGEFDPDRFAQPRSEGARPYAFAPFGLGLHACPSAGLVETIVMTTMSGLLRTMDFELDPPDYKLRSKTDPVPGPEPAFRVKVHPRNLIAASIPVSLETELETALPGLTLSPEELKRFAEGVVRKSFSPGAVIIRQGAEASAFFIVVEGEVEVEREDERGHREQVAVIGAGGYFGEIGLLHGVPRTATVRAGAGAATVLEIGRDLFSHLVTEHDLVSNEIAQIAQRRVMVNQMARAIPGLTREAMSAVSSYLERKRFAPGEIVIRQGDPANHFYIIVSGEAEVVNHHPSGDDIVLGRLGPGEYFGEIGILHNRPRTATVRAIGAAELEVLALARDHFLALQSAGQHSGQAIAQKAMQRLVSLGRPATFPTN
jgi:cytochrome P450/CRP-like cAMP-binding protein